jgi:hypothetical protein
VAPARFSVSWASRGEKLCAHFYSSCSAFPLGRLRGAAGILRGDPLGLKSVQVDGVFRASHKFNSLHLAHYERVLQMKINRRLIGTAAALSLGLLPMLDAAPARAIGCFTGGAAGAVAGHYAGHHAVLGAVGGCIAGHHMKVVQQRKAAAEAAAAKKPPATPPAGGTTAPPPANPQ